MSKNPLTLIMKTNKCNSINYDYWLRNLRIVLDFENQGYVLDKPLPVTLPEGSSPEERLTFEKWHEDNRKVRSIILASMTNEIQKQYDRLEDVPSIMLRMKDVYAVPDRHIRYAATKAFFGTKMIEGSSVHSHGVKMLSLVEKLEDLKAGLNNDTYIDVILQSLPPSYDPFIVNYNINGLEKSIHELSNMLVQYEATTHKSEPAVLVREASTSKAKGKGVKRWKRKKGKGTAVTATASTGGKGHWKRECPQLLSNPGIFVVEVNMISNSASWVLDTGCGAHICNDLQVLQRSRKLSKDEMILRLGDGKAVAAEAVGSLRLVVSSHIRIDLKDVYFVPSIVKNIISIPMLDSEGHISKGRIRRLVDSKSLEIDNLDHLPTCESCLKGKMTKKPFVGQSAIGNGLLDLVHTDVCGPLSIPTRGGFSYFITFTDDHSRGEFMDYLKENGILSLWTPPGTPQLNGVAERRNRTLLDMVRSMMSFTELPPSFWGYALQTAAKLLNIAPSSRHDEVLIEESNEEPHRDTTTSFEPTVHTNSVPVLRRSTRESRVPDRYGFVGLTSQLDNDPKTYGEAMSDIDSDKWLEAMKSEMNSMGSNQVWTLVDPPKGARPVGCKWVYKGKLGADGEVTAFKAMLVAKGYTQRPGVDFEETYSPVAITKSIRILLVIAPWYDYEIWLGRYDSSPWLR
ncbi:UNVERIFIED_CONTAM: Retrovirus-related Pol polyprotein from transposon RE2, partial [Sesamum radiatum]